MLLRTYVLNCHHLSMIFHCFTTSKQYIITVEK
nr:MAG TPA: hypothetical protein [Caudoviricetes sp.]